MLIMLGLQIVLKAEYTDNSYVDISKIVLVDAIWGSQTLLEAVGRRVDYVIASHVAEHVPDLVGWLREIREVLRPGGTLRLIVPDKRFTFDIDRRETDLADVLEAHAVKVRTPLPRAIIEVRVAMHHSRSGGGLGRPLPAGEALV